MIEAMERHGELRVSAEVRGKLLAVFTPTASAGGSEDQRWTVESVGGTVLASWIVQRTTNPKPLLLLALFVGFAAISGWFQRSTSQNKRFYDAPSRIVPRR